jgi:MerR family transcriptional regulator, multidrug-efflux activator
MTVDFLLHNVALLGPHILFYTIIMDEYAKEAFKRWSHTKAYKQSQERIKSWTKEDFARVDAEGKAILAEIVKCKDNGIKDPHVQEKIAGYRQHIECFYDCSPEMFRDLGNMYSQDPRFSAYYEKISHGLAKFMTDAINYYCDEMERKN